jgi:RND family efflux transporter MFP subunit
LQRAQELQRQNFVSQGAVDAAQTNAQTLSAAAAASRAAVQAAEVALSLMTIAAPQPGRLGSIAVHPGAYVAPGAAPLVNISEVHPVLVVFSVPQRHLAAALQAQASGQAAVEVMASDGPPSAAGKPEMAPIVFVDSAIDAATGTVRLKAELDNRSSRWWPGAYVKIQMRLQNLKDATVVPLAAIVQGARGRTVFVVDSEGLAQPRSVELIDAAEGWAAVKGIEPDSTLVLEGRQNLRAGTKVIDRSAGAGK